MFGGQGWGSLVGNVLLLIVRLGVRVIRDPHNHNHHHHHHPTLTRTRISIKCLHKVKRLLSWQAVLKADDDSFVRLDVLQRGLDRHLAAAAPSSPLYVCVCVFVRARVCASHLYRVREPPLCSKTLNVR